MSPGVGPGREAPARAAARAGAIQASLELQLGPADQHLAERLDRARARDWPDVEIAVLYARAIETLFDGGATAAARIDELATAALAAGDPTAESSALVLRALARYPRDTPAELEAADEDIARATALLDGRPHGAVPLGLATMNCGIAHGERDLWEIEAELFATAEHLSAMDGETRWLPVVAYNRLLTLVRAGCARVEVGLVPDTGGQLALARGLAQRAATGARWEFDLGARGLLALLLALAGAPPEDDEDQLARQLRAVDASHLAEGLGALDLARAVRAGAAGRTADAVRYADQARDGFAGSTRMPMYGLAVRLSAQALSADLTGPAAAVARLALAAADRAADARLRARLRLVAAGRARLAGERLRLELDRQAARAAEDELTGLRNRRGWNSALVDLAGAGDAGSAAVLIVDVDRLKAVNDAFGHPVGDAVLAHVAGLLREHTRAGDTWARLGGDEFAAALPGAERTVAVERAARIVEAVRAYDWPAVAPGLAVTVSAGVAGGSAEVPGGSAEVPGGSAGVAGGSAEVAGGSAEVAGVAGVADRRGPGGFDAEDSGTDETAGDTSDSGGTVTDPLGALFQAADAALYRAKAAGGDCYREDGGATADLPTAPH